MNIQVMQHNQHDSKDRSSYKKLPSTQEIFLMVIMSLSLQHRDTWPLPSIVKYWLICKLIS